jgi:mycothiol synthase
MTISPFDGRQASADDLAACHRLMAAWWQKDKPDLPPMTYEDCVARLQNQFPGTGPAQRWVSRSAEGEIVGLATVYFPENSHMAMTEIVVHPRERRRGIGTSILRALLPKLRAADRDLVEAWHVTKGGDGEQWATLLGFDTAHDVVLQRLVLSEADRTLWHIPVPPGYTLLRWTGPAPDELLVSYAAALAVINEGPTGDQQILDPEWTAERVRAYEAELLASGVERLTVVAVHDATGEVAAVTALEVHPGRPHWGYQRETTVLRSHRGRGLGRCTKAAMIRWLATDRPGFERIQTATGADNVHMIRVNHQLGFTTARTLTTVNSKIATLEQALADR